MKSECRQHIIGGAASAVHLMLPERPAMVELRCELGVETELFIATIAARDLGTRDTVMASFANAFMFPAYFGHNWDALFDCLTDLSWIHAKLIVLEIQGIESTLGSSSDTFQKLARTLQYAVRYWREPDRCEDLEPAPKNLHILIRTNPSNFPILNSYFGDVACDPGFCPCTIDCE